MAIGASTSSRSHRHRHQGFFCLARKLVMLTETTRLVCRLDVALLGWNIGGQLDLLLEHDDGDFGIDSDSE